MNKLLRLIVFVILVFSHQTSFSFDDVNTHPRITEKAENISQLNDILANQLDRMDVREELDIPGVGRYRIIDWLTRGSKKEDEPMCRAANHFHNPLLPWKDAQLTDPVWIADRWCDGTSPFRTKYSNLIWGTGMRDSLQIPYEPAVNNILEEDEGRNWSVARDQYYKALTQTDGKIRETHLAQTFETLGYILHLLQDMAVPAHTRNDFSDGHFKLIGMPVPDGDYDVLDWVGNPFEGYVRDHFDIIINQPESKLSRYSGEKKLTNFWDTDSWSVEEFASGTKIPTAGNNIGLAEYSNANFGSYMTLFRDPATDPKHYFQYPSKENIKDYQQKINQQLYDVMARDGKIGQGIYINKEAPGEVINKFAAPRYIPYMLVYGPDGPNYPEDTLYKLGFKLDDQCFLEYATHLIPRAIGYSADLIDYFFRGTLEITQPYSGGYALVPNRDDEITRITLRARNTSPAEEEMAGGIVELVVKYRIYEGDPFQNDQAQSSEEFHYSNFTLTDGVSTIPAADSVELVFDLAPGSVAVPLNATDVYLQLIYRGQLGQEKDGVAVGLKDIGEPTPIDIINHTIQTCLFNSWYESGSADAISLVDKDNNGIADPYCAEDGHDCETDVYPHHISNVYVGIYPADRPGNPSSTDNDVSFDSITAGDSRRIFVLTDYDFSMSSGEVHELDHYSAEDWWTGGGYQYTQTLTHAIKNQLDTITDEATCSAHGLPTPCYSRTYPQFKEFEGMTVYTGIILQNPEYPEGSDCPSLY